MDICDQAEKDIARHHEEALRQQRANRTPQINASGICCDCNEPIPPARQQAVPGCQRCITCQQLVETRLYK